MTFVKLLISVINVFRMKKVFAKHLFEHIMEANLKNHDFELFCNKMLFPATFLLLEHVNKILLLKGKRSRYRK